MPSKSLIAKCKWIEKSFCQRNFCQHIFNTFLSQGCETGTYGVNCSKTCSHHCENSENCDIDTGECDYNGCAFPGFKSLMCGGRLLKQGKILSGVTDMSAPIFDGKFLRHYYILYLNSVQILGCIMIN